METGPADHPVLEFCGPLERQPTHLLQKDILSRCMEPGLDREYLSNQVRQFAKRNYLAPLGVDANDGRNPYLYALDSALIAKVLNTLAFASLDIYAGGDGPACIARAVSNAMKAHGSARDAKFGRNPASRVLLDWQRGVPRLVPACPLDDRRLRPQARCRASLECPARHHAVLHARPGTAAPCGNRHRHGPDSSDHHGRSRGDELIWPFVCPTCRNCFGLHPRPLSVALTLRRAGGAAAAWACSGR